MVISEKMRKFRLTGEEDAKFDALLDIINLEPKALAFLQLDRYFRTPVEVRYSILEKFPELEPFIGKENINHYFHVLGDVKRDVIEKERMRSKIINTDAVGWRLTDRGRMLQPIVGFAMSYLPVNYNLSAWSVIGPIHAYGFMKSSSSRIAILMALESGNKSVRALSDALHTIPRYVRERLHELSCAETPDCIRIPFVEHVSSGVEGRIAYSWSGIATDKTSLNRGNLGRLANVLSKSDIGSYVLPEDLVEAANYANHLSAYRGLRRLMKRGLVSANTAADLEIYRLTDVGVRYVVECLRPAMGAIHDEKDWVAHIRKNQPSRDEFLHAVNVYINLR